MRTINLRCHPIILVYYRFVKRYWLKSFILLFVAGSIILSILNWHYSTELNKLNSRINTNIRKIHNMVALSNAKSKLDDTWRIPEVEHARIFSAYLDTRPEVILEEMPNANADNTWALVRIIAILDVRWEDRPMTCHYKFPAINNATRSVIMESEAVSVKMIAKTENFGMKYSAAFVICKLITTDDGRLPLEVTFSSESRKIIGKYYSIDFVTIHYPSPVNDANQNNFMSVCVPSLHHNYDKYANLIEFIEFYRMMGVDHFTFYNTSISQNVSRVLTHYQKSGIATVIQWKLPSEYAFERRLRYNGIFAALNECMYRNTIVGRFKYIVNVDSDEFIVPRKHNNFKEMMKYIDVESDHDSYAAFIFRNTFYYLMLDDNPVPHRKDIPKLLLYTKILRWNNINPEHDRSKYIVRGQDIIEMGNHQVWRIRKKSFLFRLAEKVVSPDIAVMHHYRNCEVNELVCWLRGAITDKSALKFTDKLGYRVAMIHQGIFKST